MATHVSWTFSKRLYKNKLHVCSVCGCSYLTQGQHMITSPMVNISVIHVRRGVCKAHIYLLDFYPTLPCRRWLLLLSKASDQRVTWVSMIKVSAPNFLLLKLFCCSLLSYISVFHQAENLGQGKTTLQSSLPTHVTPRRPCSLWTS